MRKLSLVVTILFVSALSFATQTKSPEQTSEQAVLQVTRDWLAAEERHDRVTLARIIADDFEGTGPMGNTVSKEDVLPIEGSQRGLAIETSELKARVFGDTAVVTGRGVQKSGERRGVRFTIVFVRRASQWQMVAGHLSAVPPQ